MHGVWSQPPPVDRVRDGVGGHGRSGAGVGRGDEAKFRLHGEGQLQRHRLDHLKQQLADRMINAVAGNDLAHILPVFTLLMLALVVHHELALPAVVSHRHPPAADAADHQALEQRPPLAGRAVAPVLPPGPGTGSQRPQVIFSN